MTRLMLEIAALAGTRLWRSALRGAKIGDVKTVTCPTGPKEWEVIAISYPMP